jgi:ABC-type phosphate transport system ATPase subunit
MRAPDKLQIEIPDFALVILIGASGSGKSTFAAKHFKPTEVISSDYCRGLVSDDETDQSISADAFDLVRAIAEKRLKHRKLTVIDATNVRASDRCACHRTRSRHLRGAQQVTPEPAIWRPGRAANGRGNPQRLAWPVARGVPPGLAIEHAG